MVGCVIGVAGWLVVDWSVGLLKQWVTEFFFSFYVALFS
jgi:hypothetical protein